MVVTCHSKRLFKSSELWVHQSRSIV